MDHDYVILAMLNNDHSRWANFTVRAKNEEVARKKAEKKLRKMSEIWKIEDIKKVE